jgi:hypothetical protein
MILMNFKSFVPRLFFTCFVYAMFILIFHVILFFIESQIDSVCLSKVVDVNITKYAILRHP